MTTNHRCLTGCKVSTDKAFSMFRKWRDTNSYIVLRSVSRRESLFQGTIKDVKKGPQKLVFRKATSTGGRSIELALRKARFECSEPQESLAADLLSEDWECCLSALLPSGKLLVFAVRK